MIAKFIHELKSDGSSISGQTKVSLNKLLTSLKEAYHISPDRFHNLLFQRYAAQVRKILRLFFSIN